MTSSGALSASRPAVVLNSAHGWTRSLRTSTLSRNARHLGLLLASHMDPDGSVPLRWAPSYRTLGTEMGFGPKTTHPVIAAMRELTSAGYVVITKHGKRQSYQAAVPAQRHAEVTQRTGHAATTESRIGSEGRPVRTGIGGPAVTTITNVVRFAPRGDRELDEAARLRVNNFLHEVMAAVDPLGAEGGDTDRLSRDMRSFGQRRKLGVLLLDLLDRGWEVPLFTDLASSAYHGRSAYSGARNIAATLYARVLRFDAATGGRSAATSEALAPVPLSHR